MSAFDRLKNQADKTVRKTFGENSVPKSSNNGWISISAKLPDIGKSVLVVTHGFDINETSEIVVATFTHDGWLMDWDTMGDKLDLVTHWMPLPKLPTK